MWTPTHVQITVHRAKNLIPKGKHGTNDAYVTINLGKEKYQTSVKEKNAAPEWHEECDLVIPDMSSSIVLNCFHRNLLGLDEFLGHVSIPLEQFQIYERPKSRWYSLKNKPLSKKPQKYRGEIEARVTFIVQSLSKSELNLSNKVQRSGSLLSLANSFGDKVHSKMERHKSNKEFQASAENSSLEKPKKEEIVLSKNIEQDPVQDEESDFSRSNSFRQAIIKRGSLRRSGGKKKDKQNLSSSSSDMRKSYTDSEQSIDTLPEETETTSPSTQSSHSVFTPTESLPEAATDLEESLISADKSFSSPTSTTITEPSSTNNEWKTTVDDKEQTEGIYSTKQQHTLPNEIMDRFKHYSREELIGLVLTQHKELEEKTSYCKDLEQYIDNLLVRVIEIQPRILQNPPEQNNTVQCCQQHKFTKRPLSMDFCPNYPPPSYYHNSVSSPPVVSNSSRNVGTSTYTTGRSRISPPKLIGAGASTKKEKKSTNPFKKLLKN